MESLSLDKRFNILSNIQEIEQIYYQASQENPKNATAQGEYAFNVQIAVADGRGRILQPQRFGSDKTAMLCEATKSQRGLSSLRKPIGHTVYQGHRKC